MAQTTRTQPTRYARRHPPKKPVPVKGIAIAAAIVILIGAVIFFVAVFHRNTADDLQKVSYPRSYSEYVDKAAREYDLEPALIYAIIRTESGFDPDAMSNVGAYGIMQVMPESFEWLMGLRGESGRYTADDLLDPAVCIDYGSYLLRYFYDTYGDERCAVAAYNAGFVVGEWLQDPNCSPDGTTLEYIPYPETSEYVDRVEAAKEKYIELYY